MTANDAWYDGNDFNLKGNEKLSVCWFYVVLLCQRIL